MRLHTDLHTPESIDAALERAKAAGKIPRHVSLYEHGWHGSTSRARGAEIKLGTDTKLPGDRRRWTNTGRHGSSATWGEGVYAATWAEWGWFLAELFAHDPHASCSRYEGEAGFHDSTGGVFLLEHEMSSA